MLNNNWCKDNQWALDCLQEYIDLYFFDSKIFKVPTDITPDNLQEFIEIILKHYQYYHLTILELDDIGDSLEKYFFNEFSDDDGTYPNYPLADRRELVFTVLDGAFTCSYWNIFPEEVPFILGCLNVPNEQIIEMHDRLENYFKQFDDNARSREDDKRNKLIKQQRIEAIEKNQPLPIKPMGIKLDLCYKESSKPTE
jgi:hypothetical protein